jgi:predicted nucleic acid-binding protein
MKYLLDVSVLVAFGLRNHEFHRRVGAWVRSSDPATFATCSITELGFLRVLAQTAAYGVNLAQALTLLERVKQEVVPASLSFPIRMTRLICLIGSALRGRSRMVT